MKKINSIVIALICIIAGTHCKKEIKNLSFEKVSKATLTSQNNLTLASIKPQFGGVVIRDFKYIANDDNQNPIYTNAMLCVANCIVIKVDWKDLQPNSYGSIVTNVNSSDPGITIDSALNYIKAKELQTGVPMYLKIRVYGGLAAPQWAKDLVQTVNFTDPDDPGNVQTLPKFWKDSGNNDYLLAFADLMNKLAAKYDTASHVRDITASACVISTVEPCLLKCGLGTISSSSNSYPNCQALMNGGYSPAAHFLANKKSIDKMNAAWSKTRVSLCFSPYQILTISPNNPNKYQVSESLDSAKLLIDYYAATLGNKAIMGNNGLRDTLTSSSNINDWKAPNGIIYKLYSYIKEKCNPGGAYNSTLSQRPYGIYFQTASPGDVGDLLNTLSQAIGYQAGAVELPSLKGLSAAQRPTSTQLSPKDITLESQALTAIP